MEQVKLRGYHGTCSFNRESIETRGLDPESVNYRSDHWLGQGVYFFEDLKKAKWWAVDISQKNWNLGSSPLVYSVDIVAEKSWVLNLDNSEELSLFLRRLREDNAELEEFLNGIDIGRPIFTDRQMRAVYFDYYKKQYGVKVVIYTFTKNYVKYISDYPVSKKDVERQKELMSSLSLYFKEKQICVSDKNCIDNLQLVYNGEEDEVI